MSKSKQTAGRICAVCEREIKGLPYQAAGIVKEGDFYLSVVTCSREHQRAYNTRRNGTAQQNQEEVGEDADAD